MHPTTQKSSTRSAAPAALSATLRRPCTFPATLSASSCAPTPVFVRRCIPFARRTSTSPKLQLLKAIKAGDAASVRFFLKTVGASRGYAERPGAAAPPPPRPLYDEQEMRRRLRELSQDELLELQTAVAAKEARSRVELAAIDFDADED